MQFRLLVAIHERVYINVLVNFIFMEVEENFLALIVILKRK
ncbi:hypothetical protein [Paenisporosarcina antarctica]|nr:hypothetical protein [Paenisporosarcina antarctica]